MPKSAKSFFVGTKELVIALCCAASCAIPTASFAQNAIVQENQLAGTPISQWGMTSNADFRNTNLNGFATNISVNKGTTVFFKIDEENSAPFSMQIYRIGYYNGNGAALKADLGVIQGVKQPAASVNTTTGLVDCSNWSVIASWAVPANAVSGLYIAKMVSGTDSNNIAFIVRDDTSHSNIYLQASVSTWQAYNGYGGYNLYNGFTNYPCGHAVEVSYNRPFFIYNSGFTTDGREADWYMNDLYPMIRFLERNGYDLSYTTSVDVAQSGGLLLNHKIFLSVGHDEYWSKEQRNSVEAARSAGVNLAFLSGNEVYWKTRWLSDSSGNPFKIQVCYKEGTLADGTTNECACGYKCDSSAPTVWTGLWRMGAAYDAPLPENALTGQISWDQVAGNMYVPYNYNSLRFWRNTGVANLSTGQTETLAPGVLGYEWDYEQPEFTRFYPLGRITMSSSTPDANTHKLSLYRYGGTGGPLVFGAGTVQWVWGLDDQHWGGTGNQVSTDMQQSTVNLFADMGVQPTTLQSGLVPATASTDVTPPVSVITSPINGSTVTGTTITISGTASDANTVAGVEVSVDGGNTWNMATGTTNWTYTWTPTTSGTYTIKSMGFDDSGNLEATNSSSGSNVVTVNLNLNPANCPCNIFTTQSPLNQNPPTGTSNDGQALELGVNFQSSAAGYITGIRFYKTSGNSGTHIGELYSSSGTRLAQATFTNETDTGWQTVTFSSPVAISANTTYTASYFSNAGNYTSTTFYFFSSGVINVPLTALQDNPAGGVSDGLYIYSSTPTFPTSTYRSANYWVDVVFVYSITNPVANAGPNQTISLPTDSVTLSGSGSSGNITSYSWTQVSGPNIATIVAPSGIATLASGLVQGTYVFQLSVNAGASSSQVTITVNPEPPPTASAGPNQTITLPTSTVTLNGNGGEGDITSYTWTLVSGPNTPTITTPDSVATSVTGLIQGVYVFQLAVNGGVSTSQVTITVNAPSPPVANAGPNQNITVPTSSVTLDGSASTGTITSYAWTQVSGPNTATIATPTTVSSMVTGLIQGIYVFQLSLNGGASTSQVTIMVSPANGSIFTTQTPPTATFSDGQAIELGVKFQSSIAGFINGVQFYKTAGNTGTHIGQLYSSTGSLLAQATFSNESASGWQAVLFSSPVAISANTTYIAAYFSSSGSYTGSLNYFTTAVVNSPLTALANGTNGPNGIYIYTTTPAFPTSSYQATNYWVDASFSSSETVTANAGTNQTITLPTSTVTLNGSGSMGTITSYTWSQVSGPNTAAVTSPSAVSTTVTGLIQGAYVFQLSVNGGASTAQVTITVNPAPPPVASAGSNQTITLPTSTVTLNGGGSTGFITSYVWTLVSGPNTPSIDSPDSVATIVSGLIQGTYTFQLSLNGGVSTSKVIVTVNPVPPPTANAGANQSITLPTSNVTLDGSGSTGMITSYDWMQVSGPNSATITSPSTVTTSVTGLVQGAYVFQLSVNGGVSTAQVTITVNPAPPPIANAGADQTIILPTSSTTLDGTGSSGTITSYSWTQVSGPNSSTISTPATVTTSVTGLIQGAYVFQLSLNGGASTSQVTITVNAVGGTIFTTQTPPTNTSSDGQSLELGVKFQSSVAGFINGVLFYKNAGNTGTHIGQLYSSSGSLLAQATFTNETASGWQTVLFSSPVAISANTTYVAAYFSSSGTYTASTNYFNSSVVNSPLTALANGTAGPNGVYIYTATPAFPTSGYQSSNYWVDVSFSPSDAPTANAGPNQNINLPTSSTTLNGSASTGSITSYAWTQVSGPNTATITSPSAVSTTVTGLIQGSYVFQLSVNGGVSTSQVTITVNPAPPPVANAGPNQTITLPTTTVTLNGSGSTGTITSYSWTLVSGPNTPTVTLPDSVSTSVTGLIQGIYTFQLSINGGASTSQVSITVDAAAGSIFTTQTPPASTFSDGQAIELGVKFQSSAAGFVNGVMFYKTAGNTGTHIAQLYSSTGSLLAQATFTNETASGWQTALFSSPVTINANTTYVAAYFSSLGNYTGTLNYFTSAVVNTPLTALANGTAGPNGVYVYTATPAFPTSSYQATNYWVDVSFSAGSQGGQSSTLNQSQMTFDTLASSGMGNRSFVYNLGQNYPNPVYDHTTRIEYSIPVQGQVELILYDVLGRPLKMLVNQTLDPGNYIYDLNTGNLTQGVYFYRMRSGSFVAVKKLVIQ